MFSLVYLAVALSAFILVAAEDQGTRLIQYFGIMAYLHMVVYTGWLKKM